MKKEKRYLVVLIILFVSIIVNASPLFQGNLLAQYNPHSAGSMTIYQTSNNTLHNSSGSAYKSVSILHGHTSRLMNVNSSYSSNPSINGSGVAEFKFYSKDNGTAMVSTGTAGPRRANPIDPDEDDDDWLPIGDAVFPLSFFVAIFVLLFRFKQKVN